MKVRWRSHRSVSNRKGIPKANAPARRRKLGVSPIRGRTALLPSVNLVDGNAYEADAHGENQRIFPAPCFARSPLEMESGRDSRTW